MADLIVESLKKEYPTPSDPLLVIDDVSFEMQRGENLAILGPSGSGKSTLLHMIGALEMPTWGKVRLDDQDIFSLNDNDLADFRNKNIGFVFQDHHLLPQLTAIENVLLPTLAKGAATTQQIQRAHDLLHQVGLDDRIGHRPAELSGGERQRVAIARALIFEPTLILADEPTGNLDRSNAESVAELLIDLQTLKSAPKILIVVTHSEDIANLLQQKRELNNGKF